MFLDKSNFPVNQTGDGGDSAVRCGILYAFSNYIHAPIATSYEVGQALGYPMGLLKRHPDQSPWSNPWNYTRDQLMVFTAGAPPEMVRRVFWSHARRFFFCQNFERDAKGSKKSLWPHEFFKDSRPTSRTFKLSWSWKRWQFHRNEEIFDYLPADDSAFTIERKMADFADPLMPDHIWHLIKRAQIWYLYPFALIGIPWFLTSLFFHSRSSHHEQNQILAQCKVQGEWAGKLYKKLMPNWKLAVMKYWLVREEPVYGEMQTKWLESL